MTQFQAIDPRTEVNGETVLSVINGMEAVKDMALAVLANNGIKDPKPGMWYPQQHWLDAFKMIAQKIGANTLRKIGQSIPDSAQWPPQVKTIDDALGSIDIAYHMNHRIDGTPLFQGGVMKEGIGHYRYTKTGPTSGTMVCDNPYPCEFDRGIIEAVCRKFKPASVVAVSVTHDNAACRKNNTECCTYTITW